MITRHLWAQILLALFLGISVGLMLSPEGGGLLTESTAEVVAEWVKLPGSIFLALIQMVVIPLVVSSIMLGVATAGDPEYLKRIGLRIFPYFVLTTCVAVSIGALLASWIEPGRFIDGALVATVETSAAPAAAILDSSLPERLVALLPKSMTQATVDQSMLQLVVYAVIMGVALIALPRRKAKLLLQVLDTIQSLSMKVVIIVSYTFVGGFLAVAWTDAIQACLMAVALLLTPIAVFTSLGGVQEVLGQVGSINPNALSLFGDLSALGLLSLIAWGLGYAGQPHILTRFMAIEKPQQLVSARRLAMGWMILMLAGSVVTGFAGLAYFSVQPLDNPETVFISLSQALFNPWVAGVITAAILSAIMSTIDSQLLVCSSVISEDFYRSFIRPDASSEELLKVSRLAVIGVALVALVIATDRSSGVLDLVSYAWAGFGAAFGPVILLSLFLRSMTALAAMAGLLSGAVTVVLWSKLSGGVFDLYELVPGFGPPR